MISGDTNLPHSKAADGFHSATFAYIEQILAEEDDAPSCSSASTLLNHVNPFALHAMETSFFRVLADTQSDQHPRALAGSLSEKMLPGNIRNVLNNIGGSRNTKRFVLSKLHCNAGGTTSTSSNMNMSDHALSQFHKGVEEAGRFLPSKNFLSCDVDFDFNVRKKLRHSVDMGRNAAHDDRFEVESQTGSSHASIEEDDLLQKFENLLLDQGIHEKLPLDRISEMVLKNSANRIVPSSGDSSKGVIGLVFDLHALLMDCAQSFHAGNHKSSNDMLTRIRQHSSPLGSGSQRLAHYFANAIESRLAGTGPQLYRALCTELAPSPVDMIKVRHMVTSVCPFSIINFSFIIHHITNLARKADTLHIVDFGIHTGIQVSSIIDHVSTKLNRHALKFRVTGIEEAQASEMIEKTGHCLMTYCRRRKVEFEYNGIARNWETISIKDLKIKPAEAIAVICTARFHKVLDEAAGMDNPPRTSVLNLIREINPDIFIHSVVNGSYNMPLFLPRFRESLFNYWTWFDMLDSNLSRENGDRIIFERFVLGSQIMNIVACEGQERVERAETYRQWKNRMVRAGFKALPVDKGLMRTLEGMMKAGFHEDLVIEEESQWILQGWKGRTLYGSSCWVPSGRSRIP